MLLTAAFLSFLLIETAQCRTIYDRSTDAAPDLRKMGDKTAAFKAAYNTFWAKPDAKADVEAYRADKTHEYKAMANTQNFIKNGKLDTPFTHPETKAFLHAFDHSEHNMLIANAASYNKALHPGQEARAGGSYIHLLCIPKTNIYNSVSIKQDEVKIVEDCPELFKKFWKAGGAAKVNTQQEVQDKNLLAKYTGTDKTAVEKKVTADTKAMASLAEKLTVDDFIFAYHPDPQASVPHLHMHVMAAPPALRAYSYWGHDLKTTLWNQIEPALKALATTKAGILANSKGTGEGAATTPGANAAAKKASAGTAAKSPVKAHAAA